MNTQQKIDARVAQIRRYVDSMANDGHDVGFVRNHLTEWLLRAANEDADWVEVAAIATILAGE